jgi:hypothetical protein
MPPKTFKLFGCQKESKPTGYNLEWGQPKPIPAKFGSYWPSGFRGEVKNVKS